MDSRERGNCNDSTSKHPSSGGLFINFNSSDTQGWGFQVLFGIVTTNDPGKLQLFSHLDLLKKKISVVEAHSKLPGKNFQRVTICSPRLNNNSCQLRGSPSEMKQKQK